MKQKNFDGIPFHKLPLNQKVLVGVVAVSYPCICLGFGLFFIWWAFPSRIAVELGLEVFWPGILGGLLFLLLGLIFAGVIYSEVKKRHWGFFERIAPVSV